MSRPLFRRPAPPATDPRSEAAGPRVGAPFSKRWWKVAGATGLAAAVIAGLVAYVVTPRPASAISGARPLVTTQRHGVGAGLPELTAGRRAPHFSLPRLGGGAKVTLAADHGRPVVLNFFASWCTDCRRELKAFAKVWRAQRGHVAFLAVDTSDHDPAKARSLLRQAGDGYPVGVDPAASVANGKYLVEALPATVFITPSGRIASEAFGAQTVRTLDAHLAGLTGSAGS